MPPMPFPMPPLFITAVKDICAINTFEKLLNILFSEVYCWYFGFTTLLFSATITDMSLYEVLNLFPRWPLIFRSFLHPPLVARDVVTPSSSSSAVFQYGGIHFKWIPPSFGPRWRLCGSSWQRLSMPHMSFTAKGTSSNEMWPQILQRMSWRAY